MSRISIGLFAMLLSVAPAVGQCPGTMTLALPLLFGPDVPQSSDRSASFDLDEAQEFAEPPSKAELAKECLKVWRQMIADGRFDLAAVVVGKAAQFDPGSRDVQVALAVSSALHNGISGQAAAQPKSDDDRIVDAVLKQLFPRGLLDGKVVAGEGSSCSRLTPCPNGQSSPAIRACENAAKAPIIDNVRPASATTIFGAGVNSDAGIINVFAAEKDARASKQIVVQTAGWRFACDRIASMNDREMILDGNVSATMRSRDVTVQAHRVRVDLIDGGIRIDGK